MTGTQSIKIASSGERTSAFRRARVNTMFVRLMRLALPIGAVALLGGYALFMQRTIKIDSKQFAGKLNTGTVSLKSLDNLAMSNPSYEGYGKKDGSRYKVSAKKAITDLSRDKPIVLEEIDGLFQQANGHQTSIKALRGVFDQKQGTLELGGGINVDAASGLSVALKSAVVDTKTSEIVSHDPVMVRLPGAQVNGNRMRFDQRQHEIVFDGGVAAKVTPSERPRGQKSADGSAAKPPGTDDPKGALGLTGGSQTPIDITATKLAIAEKTREAQFSGKVRAVQDGRTLEAPNLTIAFSGGPSIASLASPGAAANRSRLQQITAKDGVRLSMGDNRVDAREMAFDVTAHTATLKGDVKIAAPQQRSIAADEATIDTESRRVVLTGNVTARQTQNLLRGNQLVYEPGIGRMILASPAVAGAPRGNIFVRFKPPAQADRSRRQRAGNGANGGLAFSTDPNAPIEIVARTLDVRDPQSTARFDGGVNVRQGEFVLTTPVLTAHYIGQLGLLQSKSAAQAMSNSGPSAAARGGIKLQYIRATRPVEVKSGSDIRASGEAAEFDMIANIVTISGNVVLTQGRQVVRGDKLVIDVKTGLSRLKTASADKVTAKPLQFGAPPRITANPGQRDCGGKMCAVFFPRDAKQAREKGSGRRTKPPSGRVPSVGNSWSTSTRTN